MKFILFLFLICIGDLYSVYAQSGQDAVLYFEQNGNAFLFVNMIYYCVNTYIY